MKAIKYDTQCNMTLVDIDGGIYRVLREMLDGWPERDPTACHRATA